MKSATELKNLHKCIELLKGQLSMVSVEINELDSKENKTKRSISLSCVSYKRT